MVATTARAFRSGREGRCVEGRKDTLLELRRDPAMKQDERLDQGRGADAGEAAESLKDLLVEGARVLDVVEQLVQLKVITDGLVDGAGERAAERGEVQQERLECELEGSIKALWCTHLVLCLPRQ